MRDMDDKFKIHVSCVCEDKYWSNGRKIHCILIPCGCYLPLSYELDIIEIREKQRHELLIVVG